MTLRPGSATPLLLERMRRVSIPVTGLTLWSFLVTMLPPRIARAEQAPPSGDSPPTPQAPQSTGEAAPSGPQSASSPAPNSASTVLPPDQKPVPAEGDAAHHPQAGSVGNNNGPAEAIDPSGSSGPAIPSGPVTSTPSPEALPTGVDKSGVTSKSISVPKGSGTIKGMEESFSAQLSTGIATFSVPIALLAARGGAQPSLGLSYSSGGGFGVAGAGWSIGVPFIQRQTDRGVPRYSDSPVWQPEQDRFAFNGGQELVPICTVTAGSCAGALPDEQMPVWGSGWQYFRPRVEGSFLRFFWSPNHLTWRVQDKSGVTMELGMPLDGVDVGALERNPDNASEVFRWSLARQYDTYGNANPPVGAPTPVNLVVFQYFQDGGTAYLRDIFDTPPQVGAATAPTSSYAHHTRLNYDTRTDSTVSYRSGWPMAQNLRLSGIDVASKTFGGGATDARHMVRRYHLTYDASAHVSLLTSVQVEGRCEGDETKAPPETSNKALPATNCPRLPAMTFGYSHVTPFTTSGATADADLPGYEGFDERLRTMISSPPHSIDEELTDFFDINSDALPDVLVTAAGVYGSGHGVFFNGASGDPDRFGSAEPMSIAGVIGDTASSLNFKNQNVAPLDLDGDGTCDLLHMPKVKTYAVYGPVHTSSGWSWQGRAVTTASGLNPKIDFGQDAVRTQVMDVNFDGLVDVVVSTGTEMETFFALGRYPSGDGQFGVGTRTGAATATLSNDPVRTCVPWSATPIQFGDSDIKVADMNGDGIPDIVRVRKGDIRYWPGRGNGFWGTGKRDDCPSGTFGSSRDITMASSPQYSDINGDSLRLDDVNGDGLTDLVQVRFTDVDVWLNVDGVGWTDRHIISGTPASPSYASRVRLVDINGSGTRDILWGNGGSYQYMDLQGGERPWVLTHVDNGLGKTTDLQYSTSTTEMLAAEKAGSPWASRMPTVVHVVKSVTESDNLTIAGRPPAAYVTEYSYRDPVYEGRQREFRGFRHASAKRIGDENSPTDITDSTFLLGECVDEAPSDGIDACAVSERWRDNPREALKGLPVATEKRDEAGRYLSTEHTTYRLRRLYTGLDGREVRHAFESEKDTYLYDVAGFVAASGNASPHDVEVEFGAGGPSTGLTVTSSLPLRSTTGRAHIHSSSVVDVFGNRVDEIADGCVDGCPDGTDEQITTHTEPTRPNGDPTGWLWRTGSSFVHGNKYFLGDLKTTSFEYTQEGALKTTTSALDHTLLLDRFHENPTKAVAPTPADASVDGSFAFHNSYDAFGNLTRETGPSQRCRDVGYDETYAELPSSEKIFTDGCDNQFLQTGAAYDRGLSLVALAIDMQGQPTKVEYDAFGRLSALTRPHPMQIGALSPVPSVKVEYFLPPDLTTSSSNPARHSIIHTQTQDAEDLSDASYLESWSYVDGLGRTLVSLAEADPQAGDGGPWVASSQVVFDGKGALQRKHLEYFYSGAPKSFPLAAVPNAPFGTQTYDGFGRQITTTDLDGTITLYSAYHALATDMSDAADLEPGPHFGTFASERKDGHGRAKATVEQFHQSSTLRTRETSTTYLPTGEPQLITRQLAGTNEKVVRWMRYDSQGRLLLNVEPNTSEGFTDQPTADPSAIKAWRYAYSDAGDLVGTSDARGCGENFAYDGAGRLTVEDYSPCLDSHALYSAPDLQATTGIEVLYRYDTAPAGLPFTPVAKFLQGRLVATYDRASLTATNYDGRGRITETGVQIASPGAPSDSLQSRYVDHWYSRSMRFDTADRELAATTGATVAETQGTLDVLTNSTSAVRTHYSARGTVKTVDGSYGSLVKQVERGADGLLNTVHYGDIAETTTDFSYDARRRLSTVQTYRGPPSSWSSPPPGYQPAPIFGSDHQPTFQLLLQDDQLTYDVVGNPTEIRDWRIASEWPPGSKPVTKKAEYDDLYRVSHLDYQFEAGDDAWTSPYDAENSATPDLQDPRRAKPSPHVSFDKRLLSQTFAYDWLGNTSNTDDDAHGFYDRSLGAISNDSAKPYQLTSADNSSTGSPRAGQLQAKYDPAGNLSRLQVGRSGPCLPAGAACNQLFAYEWDEVGRLAQARRWDVSALPAMIDPLPDAVPEARLAYAYDAGDQRVLKTAFDDVGNEVHSAYIFESLELRRAVFASGDYERSKWTEVPYLYAHGVRLARVAWDESDVPTLSGGQTHVLFELGDYLGSTSVVLDQATSELVERSTFQAYGGAESDFRPDRWKGFREDYRFTGKEEDVEVGLQYFGARFYSPALNRWVSADPLALHGLGADANLYAFVRGMALKAIDPFGLADEAPSDLGTSLRQLDAGVRTNGEWNIPGPQAEAGHEPPAPPGTQFLGPVTIHGGTTPAPASTSPIHAGAPGVPGVEDAKGAAKGWYNTVVVGTAEAVLWNTPGVNIWMAATGARPLEWAKAHVNENEKSGELIGTGLGISTQVAAGGALPKAAPALAGEGLEAEAQVGGKAAEGLSADRRLVFQASPKHPPGVSPRPGVSPGPINGQAALDQSLAISRTTSRRVGIDYDAGQFSVFDETHPGQGVFHGHVRPWSDLTPKMQAVLREWFGVTKSGKIPP
jgi:RHS repeat-associated protein